MLRSFCLAYRFRLCILIAELKANLTVLDYKCRYYTEAEKTGSTEALFQISKKDYPKNPRSVHKKFKNDRL